MKSRWKRRAGLFALLAAIVGAGVLLIGRGPTMDQTVRLSDGATLRFVGVSAGTSHSRGTPLARMVRRLPASWSRALMTKMPGLAGGRTIHSIGTNMFVWVEHQSGPGTNATHRSALLRPVGGQTGGGAGHLGIGGPPGAVASINRIYFPAWPRRAEMLECVIVEQSAGGGEMVEVGSFEFENPLRIDTAKWQPETLPVTKRVEDLEVTLKTFASGVSEHIRESQGLDGNDMVTLGAVRDGEGPGVFVALEFDSPSDTNETWSAFNAELSDATGNVVGTTRRLGMITNLWFGVGLWPDEAAWNLKLHLKRTSGFPPEHILILTNIALSVVGTTNRIDQTNDINGVRVVLKDFSRRPDMTNSSYRPSDLSVIRIEHDNLAKTKAFDLVNVAARPSNTTLESLRTSWSENHYDFGLKSFPPGTTHLDLTIAVQPVKFAEFFVAPNRITNHVVLKE